ncbi:unnamed protein product [Mytilus coruscus]|uniref:DNA helicase n=1 Tax=Mytilus coruscus TaxID=42192 RepID=A0A6J8DD46_MYTCO|nr:unnamed protein product [Mytilus coruscus]
MKQKKKIARQDEKYRKHESERDFQRKQEHRSNPENLETERLAKQIFTQKNLDKDRSYNQKKGHPICRFGFPLPPMKETVILEPLENDDIEKYKAIYKEVQNEINSLHNSEDIDQMTYDMFLDNVLQMNDENYIKAIRSNLSGPKVFLKRKPSEYPKTSKSSDHEIEQQETESESENKEANADGIEENNNKIKITLKNGIRIYQRKNTQDLQCGHETYEKMYLTVSRLLEKKAKQYEGKVIDLEKAIVEAENDCNENDQIAPGTPQVEMEDTEIGPTESEQYVHFNPERPTEHRLYDMSSEVGIEARTVEFTNHANRISESDYFPLIRSLNKKQWEFFHHVVTWIKTKHEPFYTFLTGGAGCGKSVVVKAIFQALHRHLCYTEASVKTKLLSSLPEKQSDTDNLAKEVVLAIGITYDLTANIEVTDGLTNGSTCELKLIESKTKSLRQSIIWVKFEDARIGANNRRKYSHLYGKDVDKTWTPIFDIKRSFTYKYKTFERIQFPLRPAAKNNS